MSEKDKVIEVALNEVGYVEKASNSNLDSKTGNAGSGNYTKYARDLDNINFYNGKKNGYAWCDVFVDWCFYKAFGKERALKLLCQPERSTGAGCGFSMNFYKAKGQLYNTPEPGDQIFFTDGTSIYHTGLVYAVDNNKVYTVEGNTSNVNYVDGNGGKVCKKSYPLGASYIAGFGKPRYGKTTIEVDIEDKEMNTSSEKIIDTVKVTETIGLNLREKPTTSSNIVKAFAKGTSLKIYEIAGNWGRTDGGWVCLDYTDYQKSSNTSNSSNNASSSYTTGRYEVTATVLNVRTGAGTDNDWKKFDELTANAQKQVLAECGYKANGLVKGVQCDVSEVKGNWGKIPSGWICLDYCKKI